MNLNLDTRGPLPDPLDEAQRAIEDTIADGLAHVRAQMRKQAVFTGQCLSCDAPVGPAQRFCDGHCREDWERAERARARNGA